MKIDLTKVDLDNFMVHPHQIAGETCWLIQPQHIGVRWNKETLIFRSSLWNSQGELISASFKKFFNWGEQPDLAYTPFSTTANGGVQLIEKVDGSTLINSEYKDRLITRTRGTSDATQQKNGAEIEFLKAKYPKAFEVPDKNCSYVFEWTTPTNKIVINYGDEPDIRLIAIIRHEDYSLVSQDELDQYAKDNGLKRPRKFEFNKIKEMLEAVEALKGQEGLCVYCNKGQEIRKVKSAWYLGLHRMKSELGSYERLVDFFFTIECPSYQDFYKHIADHFDFELAETYRGDMSRICEGMKDVLRIMLSMQNKVAPLRKLPRKDAATVILQAYGTTNRAGMAFTLLDNKPLKQDDIKKLLYQVTKS